MKYIQIGLVAAMWLAFPTIGSASIRDGLQSMYMTTGNEPTIYESQRRLGLDAGYLRLRAPINRYSVVNFSPPQFDAGCGGVDLYGGSFSFINADEFRQMLRQIGANALGYAFKIAVASMCPLCDSIMTGLADVQQKLNALQVDTCKWGAGLAINTFEAMGMEVDEKYKAVATGAGSYEDTMQAARDLFANRGRALSAGDPSGCDPNNPKVCNLTYNALTLTDAGAALAFPSAGDGLSNNELLMNIAGTFIARAPKATETEEGNKYTPWPARMRYWNLKHGMTPEDGSSDDAIPLMTCADPPLCTEIDDLPQWGLENGVAGWVEGKMQEAADHMANAATANTAHSADLQTFLGSLPLTVMRHMHLMQGNAAGLQLYVNMISPYVTDVYASHLALQLHRVIETAYSDPRTAKMPEQVKEDLKQFYQEAMADRARVEENYSKVWKDAEELVAHHTRSHGDPGAFARPGQR